MRSLPVFAQVMIVNPRFAARALRRAWIAPALVLALPGAAQALTTAQPGIPAKPSASATVEQCVTAVPQPERSATFVWEMTAVPGTARMQMRIEVLERAPREQFFHGVSYPGLGQWLRAAPGVKTYKNIDKVADLSAPAFYRAAVHFRWINARGRVIKSLELKTSHCEEPAPPAPVSTTGA